MKGMAGASMVSLMSGCAQSGEKESPSLDVDVSESPGVTLKPLPDYHPLVSSSWVPKEDWDLFHSLFRKTVESATDFSWLSRGDRVLLKLALNSGHDFPATTDPWLLWCMIEILREKGAGSILVGDQSGVEAVHWTPENERGSSRKLCESTGLLKIIQEYNATPCFFEEGGYDAYKSTLPPGPNHWARPIWVTNVLDEVDHIVYLARVSSHILGDITSGMKLGVGFLRDDSRLIFHQGGKDFYAMYEEINQVPVITDKLRLSVSSGTRVLATFGPDDGYVSKPNVGLLLASEDILAHELLSYAWLKWNRQFETPSIAQGTTGQFTKFRSFANKAFVWYSWRSRKEKQTPGISFFQAGNIYNHPSILNYMKRMGGKPERIEWEQVNPAPEESVRSYLSEQIQT